MRRRSTNSDPLARLDLAGKRPVEAEGATDGGESERWSLVVAGFRPEVVTPGLAQVPTRSKLRASRATIRERPDVGAHRRCKRYVLQQDG
jgi:hypothetical protein